MSKICSLLLTIIPSMSWARWKRSARNTTAVAVFQEHHDYLNCGYFQPEVPSSHPSRIPTVLPVTIPPFLLYIRKPHLAKPSLGWNFKGNFSDLPPYIPWAYMCKDGAAAHHPRRKTLIHRAKRWSQNGSSDWISSLAQISLLGEPEPPYMTGG